MGNARTTLAPNEPHPAALEALRFVSSQPLSTQTRWLGALASCAVGQNRLAEICHETLRRVMGQEPVSDRYILGLAYTMMEEKKLIDFKPVEYHKKCHSCASDHDQPWDR